MKNIYIILISVIIIIIIIIILILVYLLSDKKKVTNDEKTVTNDKKALYNYNNDNNDDNDNDDNTILYIGSEGMGKWGAGYLNYLLKLVYPNREIVYKNEPDVELIIKSHFIGEEPVWNDDTSIPYIYYQGDQIQVPGSMDHSNSIILSNVYLDEPNDNYYYIPLFVFYMTYDQYLARKTSNINDNFINNRRLLCINSNNCNDKISELIKKIADSDSTNTVDYFSTCQTGSVKQLNKTKDANFSISDVYKNYNFSIVVERYDLTINGPISDVIMKVFLANSIPIYFGTSHVKEIFNEDAFIFVNDFDTMADCANYIKEINDDKDRLLAMLKAPIFKNDTMPPYYNFNTKNPTQFNKNLANKIKTLIKTKSN